MTTLTPEEYRNAEIDCLNGVLTREEYREKTGNILSPWQEYLASEQTSIDEAAEINSLNGL